MKKSFRILLSILLIAAVAVPAAVPALAAAPSDPVVTGYTLPSSVRSMGKGSNVPITVSVKDTAVITAAVSPDGEDTDNLDITRLLDSFSTGKIDKIEITSELGDPLCFDFVVTGAVYSGVGKELRFMMGYKNIPDSYNQLDVTIKECVEYSESPYDPGVDVANPMPLVQISRGEMSPVRPGEEFTLTVTLKNTSKITGVESPVVVFSPSEGLMIVDSTVSKMAGDIKRNESTTVSIRMKAASRIESPSQSVDVRVNFQYYDGNSNVSGSATETILIPVEITGSTDTGAPLAVITRGDIAKVQAGQEFTLDVYVKNTGSVPLVQPVLSVTPDSLLAMLDPTMTRLLDDIQPGETVTVPIRLRARFQISSPSLSVDLTLKYSYGSSGQTSVSETVFIPSYVNSDPSISTGHTEGATPNVIISQYSYGENAQIAAGSTFDLSMEFKNTSSLFTVENIVMTIGTGEGLTISSSSNTMYYPSLRAGDTQSETIAITALPTAKTGSAKIDVSFTYEYVDNQQRCKVSTTQNIAIPIYQPDRFEVELPALPEYVSAYEEMYISLPYVNKGKSEINNVRAELISPDGSVTSINPIQNLGNFASGSSGTIDFIFTPQMSGQVEFTIAITYEDPNAQEKTVEFPVSLYVEEPYYPSYDDPGMYDPGLEDTENGRKIPWWGWAGGGVVAAGAAATAVTLVRRKKHPKAALLDDFEWQGDEGGKE